MAQSRRLISPWMVVLVLCVVYAAVVIVKNGGDAKALVTIGTRFSEGIPAEEDGSEGYDGQFNYYIARDPDNAASLIDVPAYRFQRILFPAMGRAVALGQEALIPWAFLVINLVALGVGTWLLERMLAEMGVSRWYALSYGLTLGVFGSVRLSLSEPLAYGLVIGAIWLGRRERWVWCAVMLGLAGLAKETTLFFAGGYGLYLLYQRAWKKAALVVGVPGVVFGVWQVVLRERLGSFGIGSGGAQATSFELIPFAGVARIVSEVPAETRLNVLVIFGVILIPFVIVPTLWALWRCWKDGWAGKRSAGLFLLLVTAGIMPFVPFSTYREPIGILRFIVGLQIAVILYAAETRNRRVLFRSTLWIATLVFLVSLL